MSDVKLFKLIPGGGAVELPGEAVSVERSLQTLIERDSETFLGVSFLESEYSTGKTHGGRIDTLAIDEDVTCWLSSDHFCLEKGSVRGLG